MKRLLERAHPDIVSLRVFSNLKWNKGRCMLRLMGTFSGEVTVIYIFAPLFGANSFL